MKIREGQKLLVYTFASIFIGILFGGYFPEWGKSLAFIGDLFIRALMMMVIPVVITSIVCGISALGDVRYLGGLGVKTLTYFIVTTGMAAMVGLSLVLLLAPGDGLMLEAHSVISLEKLNRPLTQIIKDIILSLVPQNLFYAMSHNEVLPLIVFALFFGSTASMAGSIAQPVLQLMKGLQGIIMSMIHTMMKVSPIGIGCLLAGRLGNAGGFDKFLPELWHLSSYIFTVVLGLSVHGFIVLPILFKIATRKSLFKFLKNMMPALSAAFSTSSSNAALPVTMQCCLFKNKLSKKVCNFVLPLGATINLNGTALYESVSAVFIAQVYGVHLDAAQLIVIFLTATLSSIGAAGIPEAGLVTMVIVLKAVQLPPEGISLIVAVDWILDRCRTMTNVWADAIAAAILEKTLKDDTQEA
jgi:solute carrier family 1 (high affinity glutamate transporter) protein 1